MLKVLLLMLGVAYLSVVLIRTMVMFMTDEVPNCYLKRAFLNILLFKPLMTEEWEAVFKNLSSLSSKYAYEHNLPWVRDSWELQRYRSLEHLIHAYRVNGPSEARYDYIKSKLPNIPLTPPLSTADLGPTLPTKAVKILRKYGVYL